MHARLPLALPSHDDLSRLAREDPSAFEALRHALIERLIADAPERMQARLRGLQFRVDCLRRLSRSPLGATVRIYELMWDSFLDLNASFQAPIGGEIRPLPGGGAAATAKPPATDAQILEFRPRPVRQPAKSGRQ